MKYILIGTLLGSFIHSEHDTREACEGRAVLLREAKASVQCIAPQITYSTGSTMLMCCNNSSITGTCGPCG